LKLYQQIVGAFIVLVVVVLGSVILASTTKATIHVTPVVKTTETSFLLNVAANGVGRDLISGEVVEKIFEQQQEFVVKSSEIREVLDKAGGEVIIYNKTSKDQPLVATTRLLSSGGILFRLDEGVTVPASGSVTAVVHADQIGPTGDIGPDKFTIPGLATSLQSVIYAESVAAMIGGRKNVATITQEEIDIDVQQLIETMTTAAKEQLRVETSGEWSGEAFSVIPVEEDCDTKAGDEKDKIIVSKKIKVIGVFFDQASLEEIATAQNYQQLESGFVFSSAQAATAVSVSQFDVENQTAELKIDVKRDSIVSNTNNFLQPPVLVGKTTLELKNYLVNTGLVSDVTTKIFPPWVKKIPSSINLIID
jgi:hypothetical protein